MEKTKPVKPTEWNEWRNQLRKKNGFQVLAKRDREIIEEMIADKMRASGPMNPPRPIGDNPKA